MKYIRFKLIQDVKDPVFMAPSVTFLAPQPVKITYVTYNMVPVWSVNLECMAFTVTYLAPLIVKTTYVTERMEHA